MEASRRADFPGSAMSLTRVTLVAMPPDVSTTATRLRALAESWAATRASERASFQPWLIQWCEALGVSAPVPPTEQYQFEYPVRVIDRDGRESTNFIDCWKAGHFALEAKATDVADANEQPLRKAFGQVRNYVAHTKGAAPPFLMVVDVPRTLIVWDRWSGEYGGFPAGYRINLTTLAERPADIKLLQDIFTDPAARDPRGRAQVVTQEIAGKLAQLAATFEARGHEPERVARFLMRCVFCYFAEDIELLPAGLFKRTLETARTAGGPERVGAVLTSLWKTMDQGGSFGADLIRRFNGHFFRTVDALPLETIDVTLLIQAADFDWSRVEPSIFGTLLVRALDPAERHRLGAEYTPREYIERLVEPTVVEPIRDRWTAVQGAVLQLTEVTGRRQAAAQREALQELLNFHAWLRGLRFLDPACGSGNFLYVTMAAVKRIELEVMREMERVRGREQVEAVLDEVHPRQFFGIEVKPWAREIAELTLWIGYHQFWRDAHGGRTPPDPVLEDTGTIECRDAVLAWDEIVHRPEKDRPDPTPRLVHPVTGELVPDPATKLPYYEYVGARQAAWPEADFIVGNPPYLGKGKQRDALGDGYVEALRRAYPRLADGVDFVMYWWFRSGEKVAAGRVHRAGFITTNAITQSINRKVIELVRSEGAVIKWACRDHPWDDGEDGAAVLVAMTVQGRSDREPSTLVSVDPAGVASSRTTFARVSSDLRGDTGVAAAVSIPLTSNTGLAAFGFLLAGRGFVVEHNEATTLFAEASHRAVLRPILSGRDLVTRPVIEQHVVDFGLRTLEDAAHFPVLLNLLRDRVFPERESNGDRGRRERWWLFGRTNIALRNALEGLSRYMVTVETAKHRFFQWLVTDVAVEHGVTCIAIDSAYSLGVLSSSTHSEWSLAAGGKLEDRPRYNKTLCFDPFPFPDPTPALRHRIAALAERLDAHRKEALARDERVTMTGMYNVVEKLRAGRLLTPKERAIHEVAACGILRDIHDELDALVAEAYNWPWPLSRDEILERLVALHDERVAEERAGRVRWLRPEYQIPRFGASAGTPVPTLDLPDVTAALTAPTAAVRTTWPASAVEQLTAVKQLAARLGPSPDALTAAFADADSALVRRHLDTLVMMGEV